MKYCFFLKKNTQKRHDRSVIVGDAGTGGASSRRAYRQAATAGSCVWCPGADHCHSSLSDGKELLRATVQVVRGGVQEETQLERELVQRLYRVPQRV